MRRSAPFTLTLLFLCNLIASPAQELPRLPLHAEPLAPQRLPAQVPSIAWPVGGFQTVPTVGERIGTWDNLPLAFTTFSAPGLKLEVRRSDLEDWVPQAERSRYGFEAMYRWNTRVGFGLTLVRPNVFLPDLDTRSWLGYLAHLARTPNRLLLANDDSDRNPQMLKLMGLRTRVLRYETPGNDDAPPSTTLQVIVQDRGYTIVFSLWGPSAEIDSIVPVFNSILVGFEIER